MSNVVHRTTKKYLRSVNTPDYPVEDWIINPDLSAVVQVPNKYWKIAGDVVTEMDLTEKSAVDRDAPPPVISSDDRLTLLEARVAALEKA